MSSANFLERLLDGAGVEWRELGDVAHIKTGQLVNKHIISAKPGAYPVISSGREPLGLVNGTLIMIQLVLQRVVQGLVQ